MLGIAAGGEGAAHPRVAVDCEGGVLGQIGEAACQSGVSCCGACQEAPGLAVQPN